MKTILIQEKDQEVSTSWATYLSQHGYAVFTTVDPLETTEIVSTIKVDAILVTSSDPGSLLLLGKVVKLHNRHARIVVISTLDPNTLSILLEVENLAVLETPFTFSKLNEAVSGVCNRSEVMQNVLV